MTEQKFPYMTRNKLVRQKGFAAVAAVFLVVGLAALGAFMVSLSNTQQVTSAQDTMGFARLLGRTHRD